MASFKMVDGTLHVYPEGFESNTGVFDGVDSIHFHDGVIMSEVMYDGIEATSITFDHINISLVDCFTGAWFADAKNVVWSTDNASFLLSDLLFPYVYWGNYNGTQKEPTIDHDVTVRLKDNDHSEVFTAKKGMKKFVFNNIVTMFHTLSDVFETVVYAKTFEIMRFDWLETYFTAIELKGDDEQTRKYVKRNAGRYLKEYFNEADDALVLRLIEENLLTTQMMNKILEMANESGRVAVVAALLDKMGHRRKMPSRFAV